MLVDNRIFENQFGALGVISLEAPFLQSGRAIKLNNLIAAAYFQKFLQWPC